jgi:S-adenosylmethionine:tRNA-ribosyltransferase-isomerase (queuine synthetase)
MKKALLDSGPLKGPSQNIWGKIKTTKNIKIEMLTTYIIFVALWTVYMAFETYTFTRPQSRPHFVGFLITNTILAPMSFVLSASAGIFRDRVKAAYRAAKKQQHDFKTKTGKQKLIG